MAETICSGPNILLCEDFQWSTNSAYVATNADWASHGWSAAPVGNYVDSSVQCDGVGFNGSSCAMQVGIRANEGPGHYADKNIATQSGPVYFRVYIKFQSGYVFNQCYPQKLAYLRAMNGGTMAWRVQFGVLGHCSAASTTGTPQIDLNVHTLRLNTNVNTASAVIQSGVWNAYEVMVTPNAVGQTNGAVKVWLNNVLVLDYANLNMRDGSPNVGPASTNINNFWLSPYIGGPTNPHPQQFLWYDHVVVSKSPIGLINSSADVTPPPVPTGVTVPSTNLPATYNWNAVTNPGDLSGYNVKRKIGLCSGAGAETTFVLGNVNTYQDTTIPAATTNICVYVASRDTTGNVSAFSTGVDEAITTVGADTFANVSGFVIDATGADLTFTGLAHKIRYWNDLHPRGSEVEVTGLGGVTTYRLSKVWESTLTWACCEAQGSDGIWETAVNAASYRCGTVVPGSSDTTPPAVPTGLVIL